MASENWTNHKTTKQLNDFTGPVRKLLESSTAKFLFEKFSNFALNDSNAKWTDKTVPGSRVIKGKKKKNKQASKQAWRQPSYGLGTNFEGIDDLEEQPKAIEAREKQTEDVRHNRETFFEKIKSKRQVHVIFFQVVRPKTKEPFSYLFVERQIEIFFFIFFPQIIIDEVSYYSVDSTFTVYPVYSLTT